MAGNISFQSGTIQSFGLQLSGQGQALTNGSAVALSGTTGSGGCLGQLDNRGLSGSPAFWGAAELLTAGTSFGAAVLAGKTVDLYLVPANDGTNFADVDVTNANLPFNHFKGSFVVVKSGSAQMRLAVPEGFPLMPMKYQGYVLNNAGQTLNSGWGIIVNLYEEAYT